MGKQELESQPFINGFANYLKYSTLQEAENAIEIINPVGTNFFATNNDYNDKKITIGQDENETKNVIETSTQTTKEHVFNFKKSFNVNIIDTPGMGDTRGIEQDQKNMQNILEFLTNYEDIHGIVILLRPNITRLTTNFQYCLQELLVHFNKSAAKNILFCFTHSRSTNFKQGDTKLRLQELLKRHENCSDISLNRDSMYYVDNEAFLFKVASQNGADFPESEHKLYEDSWIKSKEETHRLLRYISHLVPHRVKETIGFNKDRNVILDKVESLWIIRRDIPTNAA